MEESLALMAAYNVPVPESKIVRNAEEGAKAAREMGYPVVLKQLQPFILHKTEVGAVKVGISDEVELKRAFEKMDAKLYIVQKMVPEGVETIVGGKRDSQFGEVVMFGLGGVFVEVLKDIVIRVAPIDEAVALEMIEGIKGAPLLKGARGNEPADVASIAKILVDVSRMMVEHPEILDLDINPLIVFAQGAGSLALDVKMEFFDYIPRAH
jgi:acyl-CoA synthetase (NDP forming)